MIDRIRHIEELLELLERRLHARIAHRMRLAFALGLALPLALTRRMHGAEDDGDVELFRRLRARRQNSRAVVARAFPPEAVEHAIDRVRLGMKRLGLFRLALRAQPLRAFAQRSGGNAQRVVMVARLFFPDIERRIAPVLRREIQIALEQLRRVGGHLVLAYPLQYGERAQRRPIVLGPCPLRNVDRAVGVHTRVGRRAACAHGCELFVGAHVLLEVGRHLRAPRRSRHELAPVERFHRETEVHEVGEVRQRLLARLPRFVEQANGIDHDRRIAKPVEEIVRIRVIAAGHRRGDDRALRRSHALPEPRPLFHDPDR